MTPTGAPDLVLEGISGVLVVSFSWLIAVLSVELLVSDVSVVVVTTTTCSPGGVGRSCKVPGIDEQSSQVNLPVPSDAVENSEKQNGVELSLYFHRHVKNTVSGFS